EGTKDDKTVISFDNVVKQLHQIDNGSVVEFTGGEPLLHAKLIARIIDWAYEQERDYLWVLTTNGSLLPSEQFVIDYLTRFHLVRISVDGPREHHDLHRGVGSYDRAMRFLKMLHQRGYHRISLNPTFTKHTINQLRSSSQWFLSIQKRYELPRLNLNLNVADRADWNEEDLRAYGLELERTLYWYGELSDSDKKHLSLTCLERASRSSFNLYEYLAVCPAGINVFALSPVGEKRLHQPGVSKASLAGLCGDLPLQNPAPLDESGQRLGKLDIHC
ncbi:MAG: radical SAM protein, partial [Pseudomonadota bacterium]|nr:radical SAM protein [Pseudomonadota bacterium]